MEWGVRGEVAAHSEMNVAPFNFCYEGKQLAWFFSATTKAEIRIRFWYSHENRASQAATPLRKWSAVLKNAGVKSFHAVDYGKLDHGIFKGLDRKERRKLLGKLSSLIHQFVDIGFTARIDKRVYESETTPAFPKPIGDSAYCYAVQTVVLASHLYFKEKKITVGANLLLENGHRNVGDVIDRLSRVEA